MGAKPRAVKINIDEIESIEPPVAQDAEHVAEPSIFQNPSALAIQFVTKRFPIANQIHQIGIDVRVVQVIYVVKGSPSETIQEI